MPVDGDNTRATVVVIDTGVGMDGEQLARLFQPFVQADRSTTRQFGGTAANQALHTELWGELGGNITNKGIAMKKIASIAAIIMLLSNHAAQHELGFCSGEPEPGGDHGKPV